jgi:quinol monooxygenase YgiN
VSELQGVGWITLDADKVEEFKRLTAECVEIARAEDTGTLQYEIYLSEDESEAIVLERYRDAEALLEHTANLGELGQAIFATGSGTSALIGEPGPELRATLAGSPVRLFTPFASI